MDKNSYETYEFLATTSTDSDTNQFFVLQDDGTILTVNKEIQYITQIEDDKDVVGNSNSEQCAAVFDVSSQQYYVDVDGSGPEMISINDEFAITNGENNVYANGYLIQPETTSANQQMKTEVVIDPQKLDAQQLQEHNVEAFNGAKQTNDLTEITLTDEQYQILEHKGWLLLESNDKIFVLNTMGLHDITTNDKLIQKLKNELQYNTVTNANFGQLKIESDETVQAQGDVVEYFIDKNMPLKHVEPTENTQFIIDDNALDQEMIEAPKVNETKFLAKESMSINKLLNNTNKANSDAAQRCDSIKIKTKYTFKDIPDKIFLGKTVNGKKLFAKVTKLQKIINNKEKKNKAQEIVFGKKIDKKPHYSTLLDGAWFTNLIQDSFRHNMSKVDPRFITTGSAVVSQLLKLPNIRNSIVESNLVVTKVITSETENGKEIGQPKMMTGTLNNQDGKDAFIHIPLLLHQLLDKAENNTNTDPISDSLEGKTAKDVIDLFHIHISETRFTDKAPQTSINLCKRKLPLDVLSDARKRHPNPVYACGSCGAIFKSEHLLNDHQNNQCIEVEDKLTIDTDDFNSNETLYSITENGNEKFYSCTLCETKFTRLFNCQKHIKAHKAGIEKKLKVYKCKMCPNTYFYSSSLSKHIVKMHIQTQMN